MSTEQRKQVIAVSDRLISIAHFCPRGSKVVDVGSGHGKLALYLRQTKIADYVIAVELNQDPLNRIERLINSRNPQQINIDVRSGDGLQPVEADEMEIVCLAGLSSYLSAIFASFQCLCDQCADISGQCVWPFDEGIQLVLSLVCAPLEFLMQIGPCGEPWVRRRHRSQDVAHDVTRILRQFFLVCCQHQGLFVRRHVACVGLDLELGQLLQDHVRRQWRQGLPQK